jgi:hypothetical protein
VTVPRTGPGQALAGGALPRLDELRERRLAVRVAKRDRMGDAAEQPAGLRLGSRRASRERGRRRDVPIGQRRRYPDPLGGVRVERVRPGPLAGTDGGPGPDEPVDLLAGEPPGADPFGRKRRIVARKAMGGRSVTASRSRSSAVSPRTASRKRARAASGPVSPGRRVGATDARRRRAAAPPAAGA